jgi:hypothetical protein
MFKRISLMATQTLLTIDTGWFVAILVIAFVIGLLIGVTVGRPRGYR